MNLTKKQLSSLNTIRGWSESDVLTYLNNNNLQEYIKFCKSRSINGRSLLSISEGVIAMWKPKLDSKKFINAIEELKSHPEMFAPNEEQRDGATHIANGTIDDNANDLVPLPKHIEAPKSFLYCPKMKLFENRTNPYLAMSPHLSKGKEIEMRMPSGVDRGYYEMAKRCSVMPLDHPYEELDFVWDTPKQHRSDATSVGAANEKKKSGLLKRIWRLNEGKKAVLHFKLKWKQKELMMMKDDVECGKYKKIIEPVDHIVNSHHHHYHEIDTSSCSNTSEHYDNEFYSFVDESNCCSIAVEEYLEPRKLSSQSHQTDDGDSLAEEMLKLFDANIKDTANDAGR